MSDGLRLFVAGAGTMGHGIAQVAATAGLEVTLYDVDAAALAAGRDKIAWSLAKLAEKGRLEEMPDAILARLTTTTDLGDAAAAGFVIEAVPERVELKRDLFARLDALCGPETVLASNTSAIPISEIAGATERPERVCGLHFFAPVPLMELVEVIAAPETAEAALGAAVALAERLGKQPVVIRREVPGFVVNRVFVAAVLEAARLVEAGVADARTIDMAMQLGCGWKMGPLATADLSGLDVILHATEAIASAGEPRFEPPAILRELVAQGHLGRKTGRGFHEYRQAK